MIDYPREPSLLTRYRTPLFALLAALCGMRLVACLGPSESASTRTLPVLSVHPPEDPTCARSAVTGAPELSPALTHTRIGSGRGEPLAAFYDALRHTAAGEGTTRIVLFGDSHSAADRFPGRLRAQLQSRFGYGGAGLLMPGRPMPWYQHTLIKVSGSGPFDVYSASRPKTKRDSHVGLSGFALRSARGGTLTMSSRSALQEASRLSTVRAYFMRTSQGATLEMITEEGRSETFATAGEAGQLGIATMRVPDGHHDITLRGRGSGPLHLLGVALERSGPGVVLDTLGIVGARARELLKIDDALFHDQLLDRDPNLLVFAYGTNEAMDKHQPIARYKADLGAVIGRARAATPGASCLLVGPTDYPVQSRGGFAPRARTREVTEAQAQVASELGCATFDLVALTGGPLSMLRMVELEPPFGARDRLHFTRAGYDAIADALTAQLLRGYQGRRASLCAD